MSAAPWVGTIGTTLIGAGATTYGLMVESCECSASNDLFGSGVRKKTHALLFLTLFFSHSPSCTNTLLLFLLLLIID